MGELTLGVLPVFKAGFVDDPGWTRAFATMLEAERVESVWAVEHVVVAQDYEPRYSYSASGRMGGAPDTVMPDPLEWLSFVAGCTTDLRLGTAVVVLPLHQPAIMAKRAATLDRLSGGRFLLGVGSGWQVEEYRACGVPYERRGARLDEAIVALRELWQPGYRTHLGERYEFERCESRPDPVRPAGVPLVIGGSSEAAARRAGRHGDGFYPYVISPDDLRRRVETIAETARSVGRDPAAIEITAWPGSWKPGASLDIDVVRQFADAGMRRLVVSAQECGSNDLGAIRDFIRRVQDDIISAV